MHNSDTILTDSLNSIRYDTIITVDAYGRVEIIFRKNDTVIQHLVYHNPNYDTTFYPDGCVYLIVERDHDEYEEKYYLYDHEHILREETTIYVFDGMGGTEAKRLYYDTTGKLIREEYNLDYLPDGAQTTLDLCGTVTTSTYFPNGNVDSIYSKDLHYEGLRYCPCGDWKYYDTAGQLLRTVKYKKCGDGETDCYYE